MLEANNTDYFNVSGIQINDPSINEDSVMIYCKSFHRSFRPKTLQNRNMGRELIRQIQLPPCNT